MTKKAETKAEVTRCPHCGACLACGHGAPKFVPYPVPYPVYPQPLSPYRYPTGTPWISPFTNTAAPPRQYATYTNNSSAGGVLQ